MLSRHPGVSAGASASINAQVALKKKRLNVDVYTICGRFTMAHHWWYPLAWGVRRIPAFEECVREVSKRTVHFTAKNLAQIRCARAWFDEVVPSDASILPGAATTHIIPLPSHHLAIYFQLFFADDIFVPPKKEQKII